MKLTSSRSVLSFLISVAFLQATSENSARAQQHLSVDRANEGQPQASSLPSAPGNELPFRIVDGYLILVEGAIGTRTHLKFLLDTGASMSILDTKIADGMNLRRESAESFNFDRKLAWDQAAIPEVRFGPITAADTVMLVGPLAKYSEFARNVDAIIGLDLLYLHDFTIDYASKKIIFQSSATPPAQVRSEAPISGLTLLIQVQGHPVRLIVDTGFPGILLFEERLFARAPELRSTGTVYNVMLGERLRAKATTLRNVTIGPTSKDAPVLLAQAPPPEILPGIDGVAGIAALTARRVHFNFIEKRLSWE